MSQNIWEQNRLGLHRQKRRAQLVDSCLRKSAAKIILDLGCAGYATSFISKPERLVVGVEIDLEYLLIAKKKVTNVDFVNASIEYLPFRTGFFQAVSLLEVLEHLDSNTQSKGMKEIDRVLSGNGSIVISVPYKESIIQTKCIHCNQLTPLYGHLRSLDEESVTRTLPSKRYTLVREYHLPNMQIISCRKVFEHLPLWAWLSINNVLGILRKGYWIVLQYNRDTL